MVPHDMQPPRLRRLAALAWLAALLSFATLPAPLPIVFCGCWAAGEVYGFPIDAQARLRFHALSQRCRDEAVELSPVTLRLPADEERA